MLPTSRDDFEKNNTKSKNDMANIELIIENSKFTDKKKTYFNKYFIALIKIIPYTCSQTIYMPTAE